MRETTAEIWIGPAQGSEWIGTQGGLNATHLLLLRESSRPAWMLFPGNFHDAKPPQIGRPKVWIPSFKHPIEDALLLFGVMGAKIPEVRAVLSEFDINSVFEFGNYDDGFTLDLVCKDIQLGLELGERTGIDIAVAKLVEEIHQRALLKFGPKSGEMSVLKLYEDQAGAPFRTP
jgi:hypothetical protein